MAEGIGKEEPQQGLFIWIRETLPYLTYSSTSVGPRICYIPKCFRYFCCNLSHHRSLQSRNPHYGKVGREIVSPTEACLQVTRPMRRHPPNPKSP